jgi:hypothetical protein
MGDVEMSREDVKKLLGGYATGTLTAAEQEALFEAALHDQELFQALADEQALKDVLDDPGHRAAVLSALDSGPRRSSIWRWMPAFGILSVVVVIASVVVHRLPLQPTAIPQVAELRSARISPPIAPPVESAPVERDEAGSLKPPAPLRESSRKELARNAPEPRPAPAKQESAAADAAVSRPAPPAPVPAQPDEPQRVAGAVGGIPPAIVGEIAAAKTAAPAASPQVANPQQAISAESVQLASGARNSFADELKDQAAKFTTQAEENGVSLSASVFRRSADGQFHAADAISVFRRGETVRLRLTSNRSGMVTVYGTVGETRQPVFTGPLRTGMPLLIPVQLQDKDTKLSVSMVAIDTSTIAGFRSVEGPGTAGLSQGIVRQAPQARIENVPKPTAKKASREAADTAAAQERPETRAKAAAVAPSSAVTLDLTLKVE